ncbi:MAG: hypothetical protein ACK559_39370, partial [bacterium]
MAADSVEVTNARALHNPGDLVALAPLVLAELGWAGTADRAGAQAGQACPDVGHSDDLCECRVQPVDHRRRRA